MIDNEHLRYDDGPLEGFLRRGPDELHAFRCENIVDGKLWHWTLIPAANMERTVSVIFDDAHRLPPERWISVVEDLRSGERHEYSATMLERQVILPGR